MPRTTAAANAAALPDDGSPAMSGLPNLPATVDALGDMETPLTIARGLATALLLVAESIDDCAPVHAIGMAISENLQAVETCHSHAWAHLHGQPLSAEGAQ